MGVVSGYLVGPDAYLNAAALNGASLVDYDLTGANLQNADLAGASLAGARLDGANLLSANLTGASLPDADLAKAGLERAVLHSASLPGADLAGANLQAADLSDAALPIANLDDAELQGANLSGAILSAATLTGARWLDTTCPDGSNSNLYVDGCFSAKDTTPPTATVTGVANGKVYVTGDVPEAGCKTIDNGTVATAATLEVKTTGKNGVGRFTATCSGAVDLAGNKQKAPVSVSYTVAYGLHGFIAPGNGGTVARSSKTITVRFRLTNASGSAISASLEKSLASAHDVRVTLAGPAIKAVTVNCGWNASQADLTCAIRIPSGVRTGSSQKYTLTAAEGLGDGFLTVPAVRGTADPEVIHFK